ncbi:MAG: UMP kinase [Candidatus Thermoplasmatota archaeon]|nr:UMP kinase [Euryarchaeota archaeon]MBU4031922.1 UMP kinase [Candidatus Thermoplasmatota archaeon]MBU4071515.1 UMP kinase [Candidatus Thermoplasmatota archaeon]MBU4144162.1 UMP kinase [Candidatus Thermoplasmatota archaeon]MBU4592796.1 UMP kinase [Candidatus Thermoplasmatota archaeon]
MDTVVVSIGGSILVPDEDDKDYIVKLAELLNGISEKVRLFIVVGGGRIARYYIRLGRSLGADESYLDDIGIEVTRLNARMLIIALGDSAYHVPAETFDEALSAAKNHKIVIMGGTHPGHTTDAVSAMLGERAGAIRLVNATSVDGVYTADPKKDPDARKLDKITFNELIEICMKVPPGAGPNVVFDPLGAKIVARSGIETSVVQGRDLVELEKAILGKEFLGTVISG